MSGSLFDWVIANKEWSYATLAGLLTGAFAVFKWVFPKKAGEPKASPTGIAVSGAQNNLALIAQGAFVNGPMIVGSNNVVAHNVGAVPVPARDRSATSPTAVEIRQREEAALKAIPLYQKKETRDRFYDSYLGVRVGWPVNIYGVKTSEEIYSPLPGPRDQDKFLLIYARYGKALGPCIQFRVGKNDYPLLKTIGENHYAFVEGTIEQIDLINILLNVQELHIE
jgi:hypothetical protein